MRTSQARRPGILTESFHDNDASGFGRASEIRQQGQYSRTGILRYEMIFGEHYVSTGGAATTEDLCSRLGSSLRPGVRVLDVGSGIGGAAFHLVKAYGAKVTGIDLAEEMVNIALERTAQLGMERVGQVPAGGCLGDGVSRAV